MESAQELITNFLADCQNRGLTPSTLRTYSAHLKHFVIAFPDDLPWSWSQIDHFLRKVIDKKEARPRIKRTLQALYSYLERQNYGTSPIPAGKVGRPSKRTNFNESVAQQKLVRGGSDKPLRVELHIYFHQAGG